MIPYSTKFSWVQNFAESPLRASEENVIFVAPAHTGRRGAINTVLAAIFTIFIFAEADLSAKIAKNFAPRENFRLYSVLEEQLES